MIEIKSLAKVGCIAALMAHAGVAQAQWVTQTNNLKAGWNAVYLHVDASYATLNELVAKDANNPIQEIWQWQPNLPTGQFSQSPELPTDASTQWAGWSRQLGPASDLQELQGNSAYLVRVTNTVATYAWRVKGRPLIPSYRWRLTGLNFIGFTTRTPSPPNFNAFLAVAPEALRNAEVFAYTGGNLGPNNPMLVRGIRALQDTPVARDQAYWIRAGESYNHYFGPFLVTAPSGEGIQFRDSNGQAKLRVRNLVDKPLTVTLRALASEAAPGSETLVVDSPPLLLRGELNTTNLTYAYRRLDPNPNASGQQWTLAPAGQAGSEVEIALGLDRYHMESEGGPPGDLWAGVLRFTDSFQLTQVDVGVSAVVGSPAGLWIGGATLDRVTHYLKTYAKATNQVQLDAVLTRLGLAQGADRYEFDAATGHVLVFDGPNNKKGSYLLDGPIHVDPGSVAKPFPLRLILHNTGSAARLLQRVYYGIGLDSNVVVTTAESRLLPAQLGSARRASAVHLPTSEDNSGWNFTGSLQPGGTLTTTVALNFDDQASNPFLHTYHPDHDNRDAEFQLLGPRDEGVEAYGVTRRISLKLRAPREDFKELTSSGQDLRGDYSETVTFRAKNQQTKQFTVLGTFSLKRICDVATLTP